jgi:hypothetical protein
VRARSQHRWTLGTSLASQPRRHIGRKRVAVASFDINNTRTKSCTMHNGSFHNAMQNRMIYQTATSLTKDPTVRLHRNV